MPLTSWPSRYLDLQRCFLSRFPAKRGEALGSVGDGDLEPWRIEFARIHGKKYVLLKLEEIEDRTRAESFKGRTVYVPRDERVQLDEGSYYLDDLISCSVYEAPAADSGETGVETGVETVGEIGGETGGETAGETGAASRSIAKVVDFDEQSGGGLLVIEFRDSKERLDVPFVDRYVFEVDVERKAIVLGPHWRDLLSLEEA